MLHRGTLSRPVPSRTRSPHATSSVRTDETLRIDVAWNRHGRAPSSINAATPHPCCHTTPCRFLLRAAHPLAPSDRSSLHRLSVAAREVAGEAERWVPGSRRWRAGEDYDGLRRTASKAAHEAAREAATRVLAPDGSARGGSRRWRAGEVEDRLPAAVHGIGRGWAMAMGIGEGAKRAGGDGGDWGRGQRERETACGRVEWDTGERRERKRKKMVDPTWW